MVCRQGHAPPRMAEVGGGITLHEDEDKKGPLSDFAGPAPSQILIRHTWVGPEAGGISQRAES